MHPIVNIAVKAARQSGKIILSHFDRLNSVQITQKTPNDFVTEVDKKSEQAIIDVIQKVYPNHSILAEESGQQGDKQAPCWIIDPLDGTANFIHGVPHFAISIAFQDKGRIEHGVIYDPIRDELFTTSRGEGTQLNNRRVRVSSCTKLENALIVTGFPFKDQKRMTTYLRSFQNLLPQVSDMRRIGAAALDLAYVASGRFDGYWEYGLQPWDMAAGILMLKEAGALVSDLQGTENYWQSGDIVTANPKLFKLLLTQLQI
jgi:myo-inositol-1(or 4)-monophosphatase